MHKRIKIKSYFFEKIIKLINPLERMIMTKRRHK